MDLNATARVLEWVSIVLISGALCSFVFGALVLKKRFADQAAVWLYLIVALLLELFSHYIADRVALNLMLIPISGFLCYAFMLHLYMHHLLLKWRKAFPWMLVVGSLVLLWSIAGFTGSTFFQSWGNLFYNGIITGLSLFYFADIVLRRYEPGRMSLVLNGVVLLYFSFDSVMALTVNFMVNEHFDWVAPFWLARALLLQLFYLSLIGFAWKPGKIRG